MNKIRTRMINAGVYLLFPVVLMGCACVRAQADVLRVSEETVGAVPEFILFLGRGQRVSFQTMNLSSGIDPVLHLWDITRGVEVAMDDNGGGGKSAALRAVIARTGNYALIVRQRNFLAAGVTDIFKDGAPWKSNVRVEGRYVFLSNLQAREQVSVLPSPQGPRSHFMYLISEDGLHIESRLHGTPRSRWEAPAGIFGARTILLGVQPAEANKPLRIYRNDFKLAGADPDADGLGTGLERQLKTCSVAADSFGAFTCRGVADLRDTDSDGIPDGWEVLGRDFSPTAYVALPTWGANPRHKDLFIEVDYRRLTKTENDDRIALHMPPNVARRIADTFGDTDTTDSLIRLFHAALVGNPDRQPGISVHMDTGLDPQQPEDAGIYGNWGGYDAINAVADANGNFSGVAPGSLWKTHMHPSRRGIFRYGPGHKGIGGKCNVGAMFCGFNFDTPQVAVHEMLHALGLGHSGPHGIEPLGVNCKPNYPSTINYAYTDNLLLSDGRDRPPLNNVALKEWKAVSPSNHSYIADLQNKFKYLVDQTSGHVDWNRDGVFAPDGQTVRGYANYAPRGECEFTRMNQVEFANTTATSVALARVGKNSLIFYLDAAGQMWYRQSTSSWNCPTAAQKCAGSSFGAPVPISFPTPLLSMDAEPVNVGGAGYQVSIVAIGRDGRLRERRLELLSDGTLVLSIVTRVLPSAVKVTGEPSLSETRDGRGIYLVYKDENNVVRWRFRNTSSWGAEKIAFDRIGFKHVTAPQASPGIVNAYLNATPGSAAAPYLAYSNDTQKVLQLYSLNEQGEWTNTNLLAESIFDTQGRPTMTWVPNTTTHETPGQFYLLVRNNLNSYGMMRTYYDNKLRKIRVGLFSAFDNVHLQGNAIDVTASGASGQMHLWAALTFVRAGVPLLIFRPRADGITDLRQANHNDWSAVAWGTCQFIVNHNDPDNPRQVRCPPRPF